MVNEQLPVIYKWTNIPTMDCVREMFTQDEARLWLISFDETNALWWASLPPETDFKFNLLEHLKELKTR